MREEFGFKRVICSCRKCRALCESLPGSLVPSDLNRLIPQDADPFQWAEEHLRASPGFQLRTPFGVVAIPSLVPTKQANGHCHWLHDGLCAVHENAPFGCAFLSQCSQSDAHAERIKNSALCPNHQNPGTTISLNQKGTQAMTEKEMLCRKELEALSDEELLGEDYIENLRQEAIDDCLAHERDRLEEKDLEELLGEDALEDERQAAIDRLVEIICRVDKLVSQSH